MVSPALCNPTDRDDPVSSVVCGPSSSQCLNGNKSYEKWFQGGFFGPNNTFPATIGANSTVVLTLTARAYDNNAGNLNLSQMIGIFTDHRLAVRLHSQWLDRYFSNVAIPVEIIFGTPNFPAWFGGTLYVKSGTGLTAEATDLSGSTNTATLMARGFQNLIQQGNEQAAQGSENENWQKFRTFLPFMLGPDLGPQVPTLGQPALAAGASVQITFTCPSEGDFYMFQNYLLCFGDVTSNLLVTSWTEGGSGRSFIDPNILPLRADLAFSSAYTPTGWPDTLLRPSSFPGGWGGDPWVGDGQWTHRLHRGTQMIVTIKNNGVSTVFLSPVFAGFLATCDAAPGEFLAFPMNQGQVSRQFTPVAPGSSFCPPSVCGPNGSRLPSQATGVIVAPQVQNSPGGTPQVSPGVSGQRFFAPSKNQLYRGGQSW